MNEKLERFLKDAKNDPAFQEKLFSMQTVAEIVEAAKERGFEFSESDLPGAPEASSVKPDNLGSSGCFCFMGGSGHFPGDVECTCVIAGGGDDSLICCFGGAAQS